ncbi:hypothetical protein ACOME3_007789 [Neoechinorhynchus agilis]
MSSNLLTVLSLLLLAFTCSDVQPLECTYDGIDLFSLGERDSIRFEQPVYVRENVSINQKLGSSILDFELIYRTYQSEENSDSPDLFNVTTSRPHQFEVKLVRFEAPYLPSRKDRSVQQTVKIRYCLVLIQQLDYFTNPDHRYTFKITAQSKSPYIHRAASAVVQCGLDNFNMRAPQFVSPDVIHVSELAPVHSIIGAIQAADPDGDGVTYEQLNHRDIFMVNRTSGVIKPLVNLSNVSPPADSITDDYAKFYDLHVEANDDGASCGLGSHGCSRLSNRTSVRILIIDVNKQAPRFTSPLCGQSITIQEGHTVSFPVGNLGAEDYDEGPNGRIDFFFPESSSRNDAYSKFRLVKHPQSGHQRNVSLYVTESFDYDAPHSVNTYFLLIFAQDSGRQPRQDFCFLKIQITDVNDNEPVFTAPEYKYHLIVNNNGMVERNRTLLRVIATDKDSGQNARIKYTLNPRSNKYFRIDENTGFINLATNKVNRRDFPYKLNITATDCGRPPLRSRENAEVTIELVSPSDGHGNQTEFEWSEREFSDMSVNISEKYYSKHGSSLNIHDKNFNGKFLFYVTGSQDVQSPQFRLYPRPEGALFVSAKTEFLGLVDAFTSKYSSGIRVLNELDAELKTQHYLYIRVQDIQSPQSLVGLCLVNVIDENDQIPMFDSSELRLSLLEGEVKQMKIGQVQAFDQDISYPNNYVRYRFKAGKDESSVRNLFSVSESGEIIANGTFDREQQSLYSFYIEAYDGANGYGLKEPNTDSVAVRVEIIDVNDNTPRFLVEQVHASIGDALDIGHTVVELLCTDPDFDTDLQFSIVDGNEGGHFAVRKRRAGWKVNHAYHEAIAEIYVVGRLNYKTRSFYRLHVQASDSKNHDTIEVNINLTKSSNDAPVWHFDRNGRNALVTENTTSHSLFRLHASGEGDVVYELMADEDQCLDCFKLDGNVVSLRKGLDRDGPRGRDIWLIPVAARSRKLSSSIWSSEQQLSPVTYAILNISLIDVNNHPPHIDESTLESDRYVFMEEEKQAGFKFRLSDLDEASAGNAGPFPTPEIVSVNPPECVSLRNLRITRLSSPNAFVLHHLNGVLDREAKRKKSDGSLISCKHFTITLRVRDAKGMSGFVRIPAIVGDKDDNEHSDGDKHIVVMALTGALARKRQRPGVFVGDVFVEDLDDWDRHEKTFTPLPTSIGFPFTLDSFGNIRWSGLTEGDVDAPENDEYEMKVDVFDRAIGLSATGYVFMSLRYVNERDLHDAARIRFCAPPSTSRWSHGHDYPIHETFIAKTTNRSLQSSIELLVSNISAILNVPMNEVVLLNIRKVHLRSMDECMDVYLTVKSMSRLYLEHRLRRRSDLLTIFFNRTPQIGAIDSTICSGDEFQCPNELSCSANLVVNSRKPYVTNSNRTSFAGIDMHYAPMCACSNYFALHPGQRSCLGSFPQCRNGGKCRDDGVDFFCDCPIGFNGPRCEALVRSFSKSGYVRFKRIEMCRPTKIHFEFTSLSESRAGLLMLNFPSTKGDDALVVQLINGSLSVTIGKSQINFIGVDLVDGLWHHVDIEFVGSAARVHLDQCQTRLISLKDADNSGFVEASTPSDNALYLGGIPERLRVRDVLKDVLRVHEFEGCIRHVTINGQFLDLHLPQSLERVAYRNSEASGQPCPCRHQVLCDSTILPRSVSPSLLPSWVWLLMMFVLCVLLLSLVILVVVFVKRNQESDPLTAFIARSYDDFGDGNLPVFDENEMPDTLETYGDDDAAGEQDQMQFDLSMLRKPVAIPVGNGYRPMKLSPQIQRATTTETDSVIVYASEGRASACWPGGRVSPLSSILGTASSSSSSQCDEDCDGVTTRLLSSNTASTLNQVGNPRAYKQVDTNGSRTCSTLENLKTRI